MMRPTKNHLHVWQHRWDNGMRSDIQYESQFWHCSLAEKALSIFRNFRLPRMIYICVASQPTNLSKLYLLQNLCQRDIKIIFFQDIDKSHTLSAVCFIHGHNISQEAILKCVFMNTSINTSDLLPARVCHGYYFRFRAFQLESSIDCSPPVTLLV